MLRRQINAPAAITALLLFTCLLTVRAEEKNLLSGVPEVAVLRSRPARFVVVGTNRVWNAHLMRWAEALTDKVADLTGLEMSFEQRVLRIVTSRERDSGIRAISSGQGFVNGQFVQELVIHDYQGVDVSEADVAFCRLLLNGYVAYRWDPRRNADSNGAPTENGPPANELDQVPPWLALGVARNFYPAHKHQNAAILMDRWENGRAPTVKQFLEAAGEDAATGLCNEETCGMFVAWLSSLSEAPDLFDVIFRRIAEGRVFSAEWLADTLTQCETTVDLEKLWDKWIFRQKRFVYMPGVITPRVLKQLADELIIHRGNPDIADGSGSILRLPLNELIARREEKWIPAFARNKIARLRILFLGRGPEMNAVVDSYCLFLDALAERKREGSLRSLLAKAEDELDKLEAGDE